MTLVIDSSLTSGQSTRARMLFQTLIASARESIEITTPYFLPDKGLRDEFIRARERGVKVTAICPGRHHDHLLTRRASRRLYGALLKTGAEIYEYKKSMIHAKVMIIDGRWSCLALRISITARSASMMKSTSPRTMSRSQLVFVKTSYRI